MVFIKKQKQKQNSKKYFRSSKNKFKKSQISNYIRKTGNKPEKRHLGSILAVSLTSINSYPRYIDGRLANQRSTQETTATIETTTPKSINPHRENKEKLLNCEMTDLQIIEKWKNKIKKLKGFWDQKSKISPHVFKYMKFDNKNRRFSLQISDLGNKGTNQKALQKHIKNNYVFENYSICSQEERLSNPFSLANFQSE